MLRHIQLPVRWRTYGVGESPFWHSLFAVLFNLSWLPTVRFDRRQIKTRARILETVTP